MLIFRNSPNEVEEDLEFFLPIVHLNMFKDRIDNEDLASTLFLVQLIYQQTPKLCIDSDNIKFFVSLLDDSVPSKMSKNSLNEDKKEVSKKRNSPSIRYAVLRLLGIISGFDSNEYFRVAYDHGLLKAISNIYAKLDDNSKVYALLLLYNIFASFGEGPRDLQNKYSSNEHFLNYPKLFKKII
jgi:hypothetical protein